MADSSVVPLLPLVATALSAGVLSAGGLLAYSVFSPRCQFWAPVVRSLPVREEVALTFDDGPHPEFTAGVLDVLAREKVRATFFVIGRFAKEYPSLVRRMADEGHAVGNHSYDHEHFGVNKNRAYWEGQIRETQKVVLGITGEAPVLFRPPMGFKTWNIAGAAKAARLPVIGWSVRGFDTQAIGAQELTRRVVKKTTGHDIVLLHDGVDPHRKGGKDISQKQTVEALPGVIAGIREKGLKIVPLVEALVAGAALQKEAARRVAAREGGTA
jgi:peptidoglycan/xylan/chitin deacetylase (PgdA/CDA1 family)